MQKWSVNLKSDMQTLKVHAILFLEGLLDQREYLLLSLIDFGVSSSSTACSHGSWGWRQCLQLARVRQWDICPSLLLGHIIQVYPLHPSYTTVFGDPAHSKVLLADRRFAAGSSKENTEGFFGTTKPSLSSACQLPLSQQAYPTVCSDYQPSVCSPRAAISQTDQLGAWVAVLLINSLGRLEAVKPLHVPGHLSVINKWKSS